jgi:predicted lactoylglutathione lyase
MTIKAKEQATKGGMIRINCIFVTLEISDWKVGFRPNSNPKELKTICMMMHENIPLFS